MSFICHHRGCTIGGSVECVIKGLSVSVHSDGMVFFLVSAFLRIYKKKMRCMALGDRVVYSDGIQ